MAGLVDVHTAEWRRFAFLVGIAVSVRDHRGHHLGICVRNVSARGLYSGPVTAVQHRRSSVAVYVRGRRDMDPALNADGFLRGGTALAVCWVLAHFLLWHVGCTRGAMRLIDLATESVEAAVKVGTDCVHGPPLSCGAAG